MITRGLFDEVYDRGDVHVDGRRYPTNPVLHELLSTRTFMHNQQTYDIAHTLNPDVSEMMGKVIIRNGLRRGLEIGTLFGFATLFLAEAFDATGGRLDTIDRRPKQTKWRDGQLIENVHQVAERLVAESGLTARVRFIVGDSNQELTRLIRSGEQYDIALIDGSHNYAVALLDFISVDRMLRPGGFVFLDDTGASQAQKPKSDAAQYAFEDLYFFDLPPASAGKIHRITRAFAVPPGDYDVYVAMKEHGADWTIHAKGQDARGVRDAAMEGTADGHFTSCPVGAVEIPGTRDFHELPQGLLRRGTHSTALDRGNRPVAVPPDRGGFTEPDFHWTGRLRLTVAAP